MNFKVEYLSLMALAIIAMFGLPHPVLTQSYANLCDSDFRTSVDVDGSITPFRSVYVVVLRTLLYSSLQLATRLPLSSVSRAMHPASAVLVSGALRE